MNVPTDNRIVDSGSASPLAPFDHLIVEEREDQVMGNGRVRVYRLPNGYGLNGINAPHAHRFPYAWEFAVLAPDPADHAAFGDVVFDTPLTDTVKLCLTEQDAAVFLARALRWAEATADAGGTTQARTAP